MPHSLSILLIFGLYLLDNTELQNPNISSLSKLENIGHEIYTKGQTFKRQDIKAAQAGMIANARTLACITCHLADGTGSKEFEEVIIPDIRWSTLQNKLNSIVQDSKNQKNSIIDKKLSRIIAMGIDFKNNEMHNLMPRYQLTSNEMKALIAYMKIL